MIDSMLATVVYAFVAGIAAIALPLLALMSGQGSEIRPERRLPSDSEGRAMLILFCVGACCGIPAAFVLEFSLAPLHLIPVVFIGFVSGLIAGLPMVTSHNNAYLARAMENLNAGRFRDALEDAKEVSRSSERLRSQAERIICIAREKSMNEPT